MAKRRLTEPERLAVADKAAHIASLVDEKAPRAAAYCQLRDGLVVRVQVHLVTVEEMDELAKTVKVKD